jgi:hypothetical protein
LFFCEASPRGNTERLWREGNPAGMRFHPFLRGTPSASGAKEISYFPLKEQYPWRRAVCNENRTALKNHLVFFQAETMISGTIAAKQNRKSLGVQKTLQYPEIHPQKGAFLRMNCQNRQVCPQKGAFLRMSCQNLQVCPHKEAFLRMSCQNRQVCPQKGAFLRMNCQNLQVCSFLILVDYMDVLSLSRVDSI